MAESSRGEGRGKDLPHSGHLLDALSSPPDKKEWPQSHRRIGSVIFTLFPRDLSPFSSFHLLGRQIHIHNPYKDIIGQDDSGVKWMGFEQDQKMGVRSLCLTCFSHSYMFK